MFEYVVEHELIADSDAKDVICAVGCCRAVFWRWYPTSSFSTR
jgi:hypothetical protein